MTQRRITLQNTSTPAGVTATPVSFPADGVPLRGVLYRPERGSAPYPAVVVTGAWTTVKEQMAGTYARELAARGFMALAFDFTGWGESGGSPRYVEDPAVKTADIHAATAFLSKQNGVDSARVSGLGICASSGYMATAVANDDRLTALALIAPWLHDPDMAREMYGGTEAAAALIAASDMDGAVGTVRFAASMSVESAVMYRAPYYTDEDRGLIPAYDNRFSELSWRPWLTYDALASADRLIKPTLMVVSPAMALPAGAAAYEARTQAPVRKVVFGDDVTQFDFYDRVDVVARSVDAVADFLNA